MRMYYHCHNTYTWLTPETYADMDPFMLESEALFK